jgi:hypothetical protein
MGRELKILEIVLLFERHIMFPSGYHLVQLALLIIVATTTISLRLFWYIHHIFLEFVLP